MTSPAAIPAPKSKPVRAPATLTRRVIAIDPSLRSTGFAVLERARRVQPELRAAAHPPLRALAEQVGATAHLTVVDGDEALAVAVVEPSWTEYHVAYRVGSRHPLDRALGGAAARQNAPVELRQA